MTPRLYLINPKAISYYYDSDVFGSVGKEPVVSFGELALITLAAFVPKDFGLRLCDEQLTPVDLDAPESHILITGKTNQWGRMRELATHFRSRGKKVLFGGPYSSLAPEVVKPYCDTLLIGEIEEIAGEFFEDLRHDRMKEIYEGPTADLRKTPVPRWDLYPNDRVLSGTIQTSRGCPFKCEFCDVVQYAGNKQRRKDIEQILRELDYLYDLGYRNIFLTDDNFTANRTHSRRILEALKEWNEKKDPSRVIFTTQLSIDAANDPSLVKLCADAGLLRVFVGVETINKDSLRETKKIQNVGGSIQEKIRSFVEHGIVVHAGIIFGFDNDGPGIFEMQYDFLADSPIPLFASAALIAYRSTPLYRRLVQEGRVDLERGDAMFYPWDTNVTFKNFSREEFHAGFFQFIRKAWSAEGFERRVNNALDLFGTKNPDLFKHGYDVKSRPVRRNLTRTTLKMIKELGEKEFEMAMRLTRRAGDKDVLISAVGLYLSTFLQARFLYADLFGQAAVFHSRNPRIPMPEPERRIS